MARATGRLRGREKMIGGQHRRLSDAAYLLGSHTQELVGGHNGIVARVWWGLE